MAAALIVACWILSVLIFVPGLLILGMGGKIQFVFFLGIVLILLPPFRALLREVLRLSIPWWGYLIAAVAFFSGIVLSFVLNPAKSIYKTPAYREKLLSIYDEKLAFWPTTFESKYVDTEYGRVHVIVSGPEGGYPVMLINASGLAAWSWMFNAGTLNTRYRTYAVDNIGEGGRSEIKIPGYIPKTGEEIAAFYSGIADELGIEKSHVIGGSIGGYISTNYALFSPGRVNKLVLLASMGFGFTGKTVMIMTLAQALPLMLIQNATFRWAFSDAAAVNEAFGKWFRIYMKGLVPTPIRPASFTPELLRTLTVPTLAYFGTKDRVIGDVRTAADLAANIPNADVRIVESGHVIGAELPDLVNPEIMKFLGEDGT